MRVVPIPVLKWLSSSPGEREWLTRMAENEFDLWVMRLIQENMPIFSRTVQCVAGTASSENSSLSDLAWVDS